MNLGMTVWTLLGVAIALLVLLGALALVDAARKGNRQFKWVSRGRRRRSA